MVEITVLGDENIYHFAVETNFPIVKGVEGDQMVITALE